jgi:hypothetical protein
VRTAAAGPTPKPGSAGPGVTRQVGVDAGRWAGYRVAMPPKKATSAPDGVAFGQSATAVMP